MDWETCYMWIGKHEYGGAVWFVCLFVGFWVSFFLYICWSSILHLCFPILIFFFLVSGMLNIVQTICLYGVCINKWLLNGWLLFLFINFSFWFIDVYNHSMSCRAVFGFYYRQTILICFSSFSYLLMSCFFFFFWPYSFILECEHKLVQLILSWDWYLDQTTSQASHRP